MEFADIIRISRVDNVRLRRPAEPHAEVKTEILRGVNLRGIYAFLGDCGCYWAPPDSFTSRGSGETGSQGNLVAAQKHPGHWQRGRKWGKKWYNHTQVRQKLDASRGRRGLRYLCNQIPHFWVI